MKSLAARRTRRTRLRCVLVVGCCCRRDHTYMGAVLAMVDFGRTPFSQQLKALTGYVAGIFLAVMCATNTLTSI